MTPKQRKNNQWLFPCLPVHQDRTVKERPRGQQRTPWGACLAGYEIQLHKQKGANGLIKETANNIGHFRVSLWLCFKTSSHAKRFIPLYENWLWSAWQHSRLTMMTLNVQIRYHPFWTVLQKDSFWGRGMRQLKKGLSKKIEPVLPFCTPLLLFYIKHDEEFLILYEKATDTTEVYYRLRVSSHVYTLSRFCL